MGFLEPVTVEDEALVEAECAQCCCNCESSYCHTNAQHEYHAGEHRPTALSSADLKPQTAAAPQLRVGVPSDAAASPTPVPAMDAETIPDAFGGWYADIEQWYGDTSCGQAKPATGTYARFSGP